MASFAGVFAPKNSAQDSAGIIISCGAHPGLKTAATPRNFFRHFKQAGNGFFLIRKNFLAIEIMVAMLRPALGEVWVSE